MTVRFWRVLVASAVVWLVFICGFLTREVLGDWLIQAHSGTVSEQLGTVAGGVGRVFLTFLVVVVAILGCVAVLVVSVGVLQEIWYQIFTRKIIAILVRQRQRHQKELMEALEGEEIDGADIGAPKKPVSALRHLRSEKSTAARVEHLKEQAETALAKETAFESDLDVEPQFEITYDDY